MMTHYDADPFSNCQFVVGSSRDGWGEEPSTTRRSQVGSGSGTTRRSQGGEGSGTTWRSRLPHFDVPGLIQHITFHLADSLPSTAIARMQQELNALPEAQRDLARRQRIQELLDSGLGSCVLGQAACAQIVQDSLLFGDGDRYHLLAWVVMPNHVHVLIEQIPSWPMSKVVQSWKRHTSRQIHRLGLGLGSLGSPGDLEGLGSASCTRPGADCKSAIPEGETIAGSASCTRPGADCKSAIPEGETIAGSASCTRPGADCKSAIPEGEAIAGLWQRDYWDRFIRNDRHFQIAQDYIENNPVVAGLATLPEAWPWSSAALRAPSHATDSQERHDD